MEVDLDVPDDGEGASLDELEFGGLDADADLLDPDRGASDLDDLDDDGADDELAGLDDDLSEF